MTSLVKFRGGSQHGTTEPDGIPLHGVGNDVDLKGNSLDLTTAQLLAPLDPVIDSPLHISLQPLTEITEHSGTTRQNDVLVETTTTINRATLDSVINNLGERDQKVRGEDLGVEEGLRTQETLVTNIDIERPLGDGLNTLVLLDPLLTTRVILPELLHDIRADVAVGLLDTLGDLTGHGGGNSGTLTISHQLLDERSDGASSKRDGLDGGTNNVTFSDGDDVSNTSTRINNGTSKGPVGDLRRGPRSSNGKDGLDSNIQPRNVEGLEHNLGGVFTVLRGVERRLSQQDMVVLRFTTEVTEETMLPKLFHFGPGPHLTLINGVVFLIGSRGLSSLITNKKIQIGNVRGTLRGSLVTNRSTNLSLSDRESDGGGDNKVGFTITSETHLSVAGSIVNDNGRESGVAHFFVVVVKEEREKVLKGKEKKWRRGGGERKVEREMRRFSLQYKNEDKKK